MPTTDTNSTKTKKGSTARQGIAIAMAIIFGLVLIGANHAGWMATTLLERDVFVNTLGPLPGDPDVSQALAENVAAAVIESYEVREAIVETLPENLAFIAAPLTDAIHGVISNIVVEIVRSDAFTSVWSFVLEASHQAVGVYVGIFDGGVIAAEEGVAVVDFSTVGAQISEALGERGFDLLEGVDADLTVELFELPDSGLLHAVVQLIVTIRWGLIAAAFGLLAIAYAVATDRKRISIWVGGAMIVAMAISLIDVRYLRSALTGGIEDPVQQDGAVAAWDIIFGRFVAQSWIILLIGVVVAFVGWVLGESERAALVRSAFVDASRSRGNADEPSTFTVTIASHRRALEWGVVIVGAVILLFGPTLPMGAIFAGLVGIVLFVIAVEYISASSGRSAESE